ncbi:flagellar hook-associated protein FlgK [Aciduricibacillus chroicocephali]|uniref:Flagellar hook-associated protein 1 n=1 Tax=Aciduricibacillus chroicocephali TaxID=3054939 RepID=A0ABY9KTB6_9BACI|nr:flagellar hook-associated protein FlgK [Bacillaceae bacterium 44XB]
MSTFHGLEMAKQALFTQQMGLYTTGHNISNVNTEGYSRQRVNFETLSPYPSASRNRPQMPGQIGQGVKAGTVQRMRDSFLDTQYRSQTSRASYWSTKTDALSRMESVMNEISGGDGLNKVLDDFWKSLQSLSTNATNSGARDVVANKGLAVAETFKYLSTSLEGIRTDLKTQIGDADGTSGKLGDANSLLRQINSLNKQISEIEPHGYLPNDLYDQRDVLIDQLSQIVNIKVTYEKSSNSSLDIADGIANIELEDATGNSFNPAFSLLTKGDMTKADSELKKFTIAYGDGENNSISEIKFGDTVVPIDKVDGSLKALSENYGIKNGDKNYYTKMLSDLDKMASEFIKAFNEIHSSGYGLDGTTGRNFFTGTKASDINVSSEILQNTDAIAASLEANNKGDGQNMLKLSDVITEPISGLGTNTSVKTYYQKLIGELAVNTQEAGRNAKNTALQQANVQNDRLSVSAVSLDEEMTNLLKFQHAYNASARSMTAMDELLDKIINSMGLVGR